MLFLTIINVLQSYEIVQFSNLINYKFTKFTMFIKFTSLHVCKIVDRTQLTIFNIAYNYNVTKFTTSQFKIYLRGMSTMSMYQLICHGI